MERQIIQVRVPAWLSRNRLRAALILLSVVAGGVAWAVVPDYVAFKDGDVLTAQALADRFTPLYEAVKELQGTVVSQAAIIGTLQKTTGDQGVTIADLKTKNAALQDQIVPVGTIIPFAGSTPPTGFLFTDGTSVSKSVYSTLFAVIGTKYGDGSSTMFVLPNTQGLFVRGAGSQSIGSLNYTGSLAGVQSDQTQGHKHSITDPGHTHQISAQWVSKLEYGGTLGTGNLRYGGDTSSAKTNITVQSPTTDGASGTPRVGSETRPANISLNFIIKY